MSNKTNNANLTAIATNMQTAMQAMSEAMGHIAQLAQPVPAAKSRKLTVTKPSPKPFKSSVNSDESFTATAQKNGRVWIPRKIYEAEGWDTVLIDGTEVAQMGDTSGFRGRVTLNVSKGTKVTFTKIADGQFKTGKTSHKATRKVASVTHNVSQTAHKATPKGQKRTISLGKQVPVKVPVEVPVEYDFVQMCFDSMELSREAICDGCENGIRNKNFHPNDVRHFMTRSNKVKFNNGLSAVSRKVRGVRMEISEFAEFGKAFYGEVVG